MDKEQPVEPVGPPRPRKRKLIFIGAAGLAVVVVGIFIGWFLTNNKPSLPPTAPPSAVRPVLKPPKVEAKLLVQGLKTPTDIVATPQLSDKRLFVLEQAGSVRIINSSGQLEAKPFLDITPKVLSGGEMGLLGLAFHPKYAENGYFYVDYIDKQQNTVVARYKVSAQPNIADPNSEKVLFTVHQPYINHNGGDLKFGPDGYLYITLGDGGSAGDPQNRAQDKNSYFGKILRIDVDNGEPYGVPANNPFVGQVNIKPEVWAWGLRNSWRISFDKTAGALYIADVGQGALEEINYQPKTSKGGENYGWRCYEGGQAYNTQGCQPLAAYTAPILEYDHQEGRCSITGGYVYRGSQFPALTGKYFYGDYCGGQLYYAEQTADKWQATSVLKTDYHLSSFGQGSDGELYFADLNGGGIYHLIDTANMTL